MMLLMSALLAQMEVRVKGQELTARAEVPHGAVVRFRWRQQVYSISRGDFELTPVSSELGSELAQGRRGVAECTMTVPRPGVYGVDASCEFEDQVDPKSRDWLARNPAVRWSKTVVVGSCKDWIEAIRSSHRQLIRWLAEAERIVTAEVTEGTRGQVERLHDQMDRARKTNVLTGSVDVLQGLARDMVSALCYPKLDRGPVVRQGQSRTPLKDDEPTRPGSAEGEFGAPAPEENGPTDAERNRRAAESFLLALGRLKEPLRREFEFMLLWRVTLRVDQDLSALAQVEKEMAVGDPEFAYDAIRKGIEKLAEDPDATHAAWQETFKRLLKASK